MPGSGSADDGVDRLAEALLGAVGRLVDVAAEGLADDQDVQVMRRRAGVLVIAGGPGPEDQDLSAPGSAENSSATTCCGPDLPFNLGCRFGWFVRRVGVIFRRPP